MFPLFSKKNRKKKVKFSKKLVIFCIGFIIFYTLLQTYLSYRLAIELSPTLTTAVYAFFGTELAAMALIRVLDKEDSKGATSNTRKSKNAAPDNHSGGVG